MGRKAADRSSGSDTAELGATPRGTKDGELDAGEIPLPQGYARAHLSVGQQIKLHRERRGLPQAALANALGKSTSLISLWEGGRRQPPVDALREIAQFLERAADVLAGQFQLDSDERSRILSDLTAVVDSWRTLLTAAQLNAAGRLEAADDRLDAVLARLEQPSSLRIRTLMQAAETASQRGDLTSAEKYISRARLALDASPDRGDAMLVLRAEVEGIEGMIAVRLGQYARAASLVDHSTHLYDELASGSTLTDDVVCLGLGRSYKRRAQVALFQGEAALAYTHCVTAEAKFNMAPQSASRDRWLRRTAELKAGAMVKLGEFGEAIALRLRVRAACEATNDTYGLVKNALYLAEDYRRRIKDALEQAGLSDTLAPDARRQLIARVLRDPDLADALDLAEDYARQARRELGAIGERILLGRCLRTFGIILRYRAARLEDPSERAARYVQAQDLLDSALHLDSSIGQERRIPSVYVALADLAWDRGELGASIAYYEAALQALDRPFSASTDQASTELRQRVHKALGMLQGVPPAAADAHVAPVAAHRWRALCTELVEVVRDYVENHHVAPAAHSDREFRWLRELKDFEERPGGRLLAQNLPSASLALMLPAGYLPEAVTLHVQREQAFRRQIVSAREQSHDLWCRRDVERALWNPETRALTREQLERARQYMREHRAGYVVDAALDPLPLGFALKGALALVEVPIELAAQFADGAADSPSGGDMRCYVLRDAALARRLDGIFHRLVEEVRRTADGPESTAEWLATLTAPWTSPPYPGHGGVRASGDPSAPLVSSVPGWAW